MIKSKDFIAEVEKYKKLTDTTNADLRRITGWSERTMARRFEQPETIRLGEAETIASYLGMRQWEF